MDLYGKNDEQNKFFGHAPDMFSDTSIPPDRTGQQCM
jgi:hypothetical protein